MKDDPLFTRREWVEFWLLLAVFGGGGLVFTIIGWVLWTL